MKREQYMISNEFIELLNKNGILYSVVTYLETGKIECYGDKTKLKYEGLLKKLFFDIESIISLNNSLVGNLMPRIWGQGELACIVSKPQRNIIIGLFYNDDGDVVKRYNFSKEIDMAIKSIWMEV